MHQAIRKVLAREVLQIQQHLDEAIFDEVHYFLKIHRSCLTKSPGGAEIKVKDIGGRKAYYTNEQVLYEYINLW